MLGHNITILTTQAKLDTVRGIVGTAEVSVSQYGDTVQVNSMMSSSVTTSDYSGYRGMEFCLSIIVGLEFSTLLAQNL